MSLVANYWEIFRPIYPRVRDFQPATRFMNFQSLLYEIRREIDEAVFVILFIIIVDSEDCLEK